MRRLILDRRLDQREQCACLYSAVIAVSKRASIYSYDRHLSLWRGGKKDSSSLADEMKYSVFNLSAS